jgi:hypothetical protein
MRRLARSRSPVIVGPWLSEVGFELLYWIPFLRRLLAGYDIDPGRVTAVSRGGVRGWYASIADNYAEIFEEFSPTHFARENRQREIAAGLKKQMAVAPFDRLILQRVADRHGLAAYDLLHPSWMYQLFSAYWRGWMHLESLQRWCDYAPLILEEQLIVPPPVTGDYVAAKFYFSDCFPDTPANREFISRVLRHVSRRLPVVLLNTDLQVDDHRDAEAIEGRCIFDCTNLMRPENNLAVQTSLVAKARYLLCTYGGFSYLGPMLGKPTYSFYSVPNFVGLHLQLAHAALNHGREGFLAVLPTGSAEWFADELPARVAAA